MGTQNIHSRAQTTRRRWRRATRLALVTLAACRAPSLLSRNEWASVFALSTAQQALALLVKVIGVLFGIVLLPLLGICFGGGPLIGSILQASIERFDTRTLGVDVSIESLKVSVHTGLIDVHGLIVGNAAGYSAEYILKVDRALVDVDMRKLFLSGFRKVLVQKIIFSNVDVIWEKSGLRHSNIKQMLDFIAPDRPLDPDHRGDGTAATQEPNQGDETARQQPGPRRKREVRLQTVRVQDVGIKLASHILHGAGVRLALADIDYQNFSVDHGSYTSDDIAKTLLLSILKTVVANAAGKSIGDAYF